ncbi:methyltransferase [Mycoplasma sp. ATU-Cv-508]|uniref:methyltransferase n=1 Tax=Mycoplasma sp. ATU-Cv-508 TaxID=2048001 RepID=UPI001374B6D3
MWQWSNWFDFEKSFPDLKITLVDKDPVAVKQTRINALKNKLAVHVIRSDWFSNLKPQRQFDLIVANPPYIKDSTHLDSSVVKHEPSHALFGGPDGNAAYRAILESFASYLKPGGYLVFEIGPDNVSFLRSQNFNLKRDINGKWRIAYRRF